MARKTVKIGNKTIGENHPTFIVGEIGINHNGDLDIAKKLIDVGLFAGCDAVKFQKRNPDLAVPDHQKQKPKKTPWGEMPYIEYKKRIEFGEEEYRVIDQYAKQKEIMWFVSPWDEDSVGFLEKFNVPCYKIASALLTDHRLLIKVRELGKPILLSTGMSTPEQIDQAIEVLGGTDDLVILHCNSSYPARNDELNLRVIETLNDQYDCPIGYSGHETGLQTTYAAVALGAAMVERHITLDRAMWGTDQAASVEPFGLLRLVRDIRAIDVALGDGKIRVYESEVLVMEKLRRRDDTKNVSSK
ncbi:MAG: N-acetylneuraminate synthase family protein [Desulfobacteraceae bacterium]|nr:N-acetylneuraminate synthase family protein [Desulfobacteraceae bacterium]